MDRAISVATGAAIVDAAVGDVTPVTAKASPTWDRCRVGYYIAQPSHTGAL
jgi:hypothetical protein